MLFFSLFHMLFSFVVFYFSENLREGMITPPFHEADRDPISKYITFPNVKLLTSNRGPVFGQ